MEKKFTTEDIKKKASGFLSTIHGVSEKFIHEAIDQGSKLTDKVSKTVSESYSNLVDAIGDITASFKETYVHDLDEGDLVISPVNIVDSAGKVLVKAGQIFEFKPELAQYIKTPLYIPDFQAGVNFAIIQEHGITLKWIIQNMPDRGTSQQIQNLESYLRQRIDELQPKKQEETA